MKTKHTPGPWEITSYNGKTEIKASGETQHMGHRWTVAQVFGDTGEIFHGHGSPEANARLIAVAPEMLEALERMAEHIRKNTYPNIQGIACDIFNAIAKATTNSL